MSDERIRNLEKNHLASVYQKFPPIMVKGKGAVMYDVNGRAYIDCMSSYGTSILGHSHPRIVEAIKSQADELLTCHGSYYNNKRAELLEKLIKITPKGLQKVFFSNSGAESIECALKIAIKYTRKSEIVSTYRGYHGKTSGALSATWNPKYRKNFNPLILKNFHFVPFGDVSKAEKIIDNKTAAMIVEPIQGEGGVHVSPNGYLKSLRDICTDNGTILIFDEVQTGFGRTGRMWASEHWNVVPDIMCLAKGMAGGIPIGATISRRDIMDSLERGEHSSTFGGNPLACSAASATIDIIIEEKLVERARILGKILKSYLEEMVKKFRLLREVRGLGLMLGLESRTFINDIIMRSLDQGLILLYSGKNVIRFLPPLTIEKEQLKRAINILNNIFEEKEKKI